MRRPRGVVTPGAGEVCRVWQALVRSWLQQQVRRSASDALRAATQGEQASAPPPGPCDVGVVFALGIEAGGFVDLLEGAVITHAAGVKLHAGTLRGRRVVAAETGVGQRSAAAGTQALIAGHKPAWVVSAGFAGGLDPRLERGDILMADTLVDGAGRRLAIDLKLDPSLTATQKRLHVGACTTTDKVLYRPEDKHALGKESGALAVDMESWAVGEVCRQAKTRFLSVRIISDAVDDKLPADVEALARQKTNAGRLGAAAGALFRRPGSIKDMLQLKHDALVFSDRLARFLAGVVEQLAPRSVEKTD
jgi:adenosylhomocysteine nucleosidase